MPGLKTYTVVYDKIVNSIIVPVIFKSGDSVVRVKAIIDTGATSSFVSDWIPAGFNAIKCPELSLTTFGEGYDIRSVYKMDMILSSGVSFQNEFFTSLKDQNRSYDAVIGMNILSRTDFSISNYNGRTTFTLRIPSQSETLYSKPIDAESDLNNLLDNFENEILNSH